MDKTKKINSLKGLVIMLSLVLVSCSKEDRPALESNENSSDVTILSKELIANANMDEKLAYKDFHLINMMEEVIVAQNPNFGEIEELRFTKDNEPVIYVENFLKRTLEEKGPGITAIKSSTIESFEALQDLEGDTWYPVLTNH